MTYRVDDYSNQFNIAKFLEDHRNFKLIREKLKRDLDNIPLLPSKKDDVTGVRGGGKTSLTETVAMKRMVIEDSIQELDKLMSMYDYAFSRLTEREQDVITLFYSSIRSTPIKRTAYCRKYCTNESDLYSKDKPEAVNHMRVIIEQAFKF